MNAINKEYLGQLLRDVAFVAKKFPKKYLCKLCQPKVNSKFAPPYSLGIFRNCTGDFVFTFTFKLSISTNTEKAMAT